jgi:hypothetical protein
VQRAGGLVWAAAAALIVLVALPLAFVVLQAIFLISAKARFPNRSGSSSQRLPMRGSSASPAIRCFWAPASSSARP